MPKPALTGETLGERIWEAIQNNGWTKAVLLRNLGERGLRTQRKTLDDWIANKAEIKTTNLQALADVLGYDIGELTRTQSKPDPNLPLSRVQLFEFLDSINVPDAARRHVITDIESYPPPNGPSRAYVMAILRAFTAGKHRPVNAAADEEADRAGAKYVAPEALREAVAEEDDVDRDSEIPPPVRKTNDD